MNIAPEELVDRKDWILIAGSIEKNLSLTEDDLVLLSKDCDWRVRAGVVCNRNTTSKILNYLVDDEVNIIRQMIANNPNTPPEALDKLTNEDSFFVILDILNHKNISTKTLERFAHMKDRGEYLFGSWRSIHDKILSHPNTPQHIKDYLTAVEFMGNYYESENDD